MVIRDVPEILVDDAVSFQLGFCRNHYGVQELDGVGDGRRGADVFATVFPNFCWDTPYVVFDHVRRQVVIALVLCAVVLQDEGVHQPPYVFYGQLCLCVMLGFAFTVVFCTSAEG